MIYAGNKRIIECWPRMDDWKSSLRNGINSEEYRSFLQTNPIEAASVLLMLRTRYNLTVEEFNRAVVDVWSSLGTPIPQLSASGLEITYLPTGTADWANLPYDIFVYLIMTGRLTGKDLLAMCVSSPAINEKCNHRDQELFRNLLQREFGVALPPGQNPRTEYLRRHKFNVVVCGNGQDGRLGLGNQNGRVVPTVQPRLQGIFQIVASRMHGLALDHNGRVWAFGLNAHAQMGLGDQQFRLIPVLNPHLQNIVQMSTSVTHSLFLDNLGQVWVAGSNALGVGDTHMRMLPTLNTYLQNKHIIQVAAGLFHSLCLDARGRVWVFGYNDYGSPGPGNHDHDQLEPVINPYLENIVQVAASERHSFFLDNQGRVWVTGHGAEGQLGLGAQTVAVVVLNPHLQNIVQISTTNKHSLFLDNRGQVWVSGKNNFGQLGLGNLSPELSPVLNPHLQNIVQVSAGSDHSLFLDDQKRVWVAGSGQQGQLGLADQGNRIVPTLNPHLQDVTQVVAGGDQSFFIH
jgi:alpha-tubulin suppressor-like RCC1 family protein